MPLGNSGTDLSRRDIEKIARRFNAGKSRDRISPEGTVERGALGRGSIQSRRPWVSFFSHPFGTRAAGAFVPPLKRGAIVKCPSGTGPAQDSGVQANTPA